MVTTDPGAVSRRELFLQPAVILYGLVFGLNAARGVAPPLLMETLAALGVSDLRRHGRCCHDQWGNVPGLQRPGRALAT